MATSNTPAKAQGANAARREQALQRFSELVMQVPEADDDDGTGILERILDAKSLTDLQDDGDLPSSKDLVGKRVVVTGIKRRPSDKGGTTGWYLICEGYQGPKRTPLTFSAGGDSVMAKLSQAYLLGIFPVAVEFVSAETRSGNTAVDCKITAAGNAPKTIDA